jgi:hypothetical protein
MPSLEYDTDFTIGFEAADTWAMSRTRVDDDKGPTRPINFNARRRNDPDQAIIDGPVELATIKNKLSLVIQDVRGGLRHLFAVLISALTHHIPKQNTALGGVDRVLHRGRKHAKRR